MNDPQPSDNLLPEIIARLMELGKPYSPMPHGCPPAPNCFCGPIDPVSAAAELLQEFSSESLRNYELLEDRPSGEVALAPEYTAAAGPMTAAVRPGETKAFALVGARVTLPVGRLSLDLMLGDGLTREQLRDTGGLLLLTKPGPDAPTFRAWGAAAAPCPDPSQLSAAERQELLTLLQSFHLEPGAETPRRATTGARPKERKKNGPATQPPMTLSLRLAGWSPNCSATHETDIRTYVTWFANAERLLSAQFGDLAVWLPTLPEQAGLEWLLQNGTAAALLQAVHQSCADSSFEIAHVAQPDFRVPGSAQTFADAMQDFFDAVNGAKGEESIEAASAILQQHARQHLVLPFQELALKAEDPLLRSRYMMAGNEVAIGLPLACRAHAGLARPVDDPQSGLSPDVAALLREHGKSIDRALRIHKSLT